MTTHEAREQTDTAVRQLVDLHRSVTAACAADPDAHDAFTAASEWTRTLSGLIAEMSQVRADIAARIWADEQLSLQGLATRIGVSKARAQQFVNDASQRQREGTR